ncbi:ArsR/SmtB family transcription factor [Streptomyces sp. NPDC057718]|uniref:ArsR/SmtB family transcription factor n=1 Tax=unclassified Streptomyces TaxID=2593676 RepID=UPI0036C909B0
MGRGPDPPLGGNELLRVLTALANPHRLRIMAALSDGGPNYVSRLARELGIGRPLLHMHLQRLEAAGLISGRLELSDGGKTMRFFEVTPFAHLLTPEAVTHAAHTLTDPQQDAADATKEESQ